MDTDALIRALAREATPVRRGSIGRALAAGLAVGAAAAMILAVGGLGVRADLAGAAGTMSFWAKGAWTGSIAGIGLFLTAQLARPDSQRLKGWWLAAVPLAALSGLCGAELMQAAPAVRAGLIFGGPWSCPPLILMLAAPIFLGLASALQRMAPTRLSAAGAVAGLAAGGLAATFYSLGCEEVSPTYILTRYSFAILLAAAGGALLGPRLLRW